jgi:hypothetical protein
MTGKVANDIRRLLRTNDGMTTAELCAALDKTRDKYAFKKRVAATLHTMPDAYIDRWMPAHNNLWTAVWCVVIPPENCPKPSRKHDDNIRCRR